MHHQTSMARELLGWYRRAGRDLPWRKTKDPYRIWVSEIMLQQTRVETVKSYYERFLRLFPTVATLAEAPQEEVLKAWEGLGYYSRARNLQKAAQDIITKHGGAFPERYEELLRLPGIGAYTAGAIASIAFGERTPAIDGNVYRVTARVFGIREDISATDTQRRLRALVTENLPDESLGDYNQALMELGATVCVPGVPRCGHCPWMERCDAYAEKDAQLLPVQMKKNPPKRVSVAVCLLTFGKQILVARRQQRMLHGLYVFHLIEEETRGQAVQELLSEQGFACRYQAHLGAARHVFTHRVWEMELLHYDLLKSPSPALLSEFHARLVAKEALTSLPFPAAMRAAREQAVVLLSKI